MDSRAVLNRLVNMHFARREESGTTFIQLIRHMPWDAYPRVTNSIVTQWGLPSLPAMRCGIVRRIIFKRLRKPRAEWKTINDCAAQLDEFDLRYAGQDYDTAASVLLDIDFDYLLLWGHARRVVELHERLGQAQ